MRSGRDGPGAEGDVDLELDLGSCSAHVDGQKAHLPPKEFRLLAELARRPKETVSSSELIRRVWPEIDGMTSQDLYWHVWRLRKLIGDQQRTPPLISNRKGFGYALDVEAHRVRVHTGIRKPTPGGDAKGGVNPMAEEPLKEEVSASSRKGSFAMRIQRRRRGALVAAAVAAGGLALVAGGWVASSRLTQDRPRGGSPSYGAPSSGILQEGGNDPDGKSSEKRDARGVRKREHGGGGLQTADAQRSGIEAAVLAARATEQSARSPTKEERPRKQEEKSQDKDSSSPSAPQANADLYHLYDPKTGDHYMTTSTSAANQKQAAGYEVTVEGRVFMNQVKETRRIQLDDSSAYVYESSQPSSGESVLPLFRLSKDDDFYYTSSSSQANQAEAQGWSRQTVGHIAT